MYLSVINNGEHFVSTGLILGNVTKKTVFIFGNVTKKDKILLGFIT